MPETVTRTRSDRNLAWLDLEMTGLHPERDEILQAALIVTDHELNVLEEFVCDIWQPQEALDKMTPFVREMHTKTGLLGRVSQSNIAVAEAERRLMQRVTGWCEFPAYLCGNSIGQDRKFVDKYMPGLAGYLHYRMLDVTALKVFAEVAYGPEAVFPKPTANAHDALVDIKNSIAELAYYKRTLMR